MATKRKAHQPESSAKKAKLSDSEATTDSDPEEHQHHPTSSSSSRRLPTTDELSAISSSSSLYRSTQFHFLLNSLLSDVAPPQSPFAAVDKFLQSLHPFLTSLPAYPPTHPLEAAKKLQKNGTHVPWSNVPPTEEVQYKVAFEPPNAGDIYIVGSYAGKKGKKTLVRSRDGTYTVDLAIDMPVSLLQEKDYRDYRIFHKRAFYLAYIASYLTGSKSPFKDKISVSFSNYRDNSRLVSLIISPEARSFSSAFQIKIFLSLPSSHPFPPARLSPTTSSLRTSNSDPLPTPHYNADVCTLAATRKILLVIHQFSSQIQAFRDTLTLLKVWANQRGYASGSKESWHFHGFEQSSLLWGHLLGLAVSGEDLSVVKSQKGRKAIHGVGKNLSSYQLFRVVMNILSMRNFVTHPVFMQPTPESSAAPFPKTEWLNTNDSIPVPILVDPSGSLNLLANIPPSSMDRLSLDAKHTLSILNLPIKSSEKPHGLEEEEVFREIWAKDFRPPLSRYDTFIEFSPPPSIKSKTKLFADAEHDFDSSRDQLLAHIGAILTRGLSDRVQAISILASSSSSFAVGIGLNFSSEITHHALRLVDHGPAPTGPDSETESPELKAWKALWGPKSELRRFKDGAIRESVVWELQEGQIREGILARMVRYLLDYHFGITEDLKEKLADLDSVLRYHGRDLAENSWVKAHDSFTNLSKVLRSLCSSSEIPLGLHTIHVASPFLRYTSLFPPSPNRSIEIILQFESSSSWPDDLAAAQSVKLALLSALATALLNDSSWRGGAHVVTGSPSHSNLELESWDAFDKATLEITTPDGFVFSARIYHPREATLLRRLISPSRLDPPSTPREKHLASLALHLHLRRYIHSPRHHTAVLAVHHRYPAFSHTVRLAKRWINSHLLGGSIDEVAVELLVATALFGNTGPREGFGSGPRGLAIFLRWLAEWDWTFGADIPLYSIAKSEEETAPDPLGGAEVSSEGILTKGASLHLRTALDTQGTVFTTSGPSAVIARRLNAIAKACWKVIMDEASGINKTLFDHPLTGYDFLIHLKSDLPGQEYNIKQILHPSPYKNLALAAEPNPVDGDAQVDFDPAAMYYQDIKRIYIDSLELLCDPSGGSVIGGVWNPSLKEPRKWRVRLGYSSAPTDTGKGRDTVVLNESAILEEMRRMGKGIVGRIEILKSRSSEEDMDEEEDEEGEEDDNDDLEGDKEEKGGGVDEDSEEEWGGTGMLSS